MLRKEYISCSPIFSEKVSITKDNFSIYLHELNDNLKQFMLFGGYPSVVLSNEKNKKHQRIEEIYTSYLQKDIAGYLGITHLEAFRKLVIFLAIQQGSLVNIHELSNSLGIHRKTVEKYIYYLEETFVINTITPFFENRRTELSKMSKNYFIDPGLRNFAVGNYSRTDNLTDLGAILEGVVASFLKQKKALNQRVHFWRTKSGAEVDFLIVDEKPETSIEVKAKAFQDINISRGYRSFLEKYKPLSAILLNQNLWTEKQFGDVKVEMIPSAVYFYSGLDKK